MPPGLLIFAAILVLLVTRIRPRIFSSFLFWAMLTTWLLSTPWFSFILLDYLQDQYPPLEIVPENADVIVLLGGGRERYQNEFGQTETLGILALARARYAGHLARKTGLPVIATGAKALDDDARSQAELLRDYLVDELKVPVVLTENQSTTTFENARYAIEIMKQRGYQRPLIVTHYLHMPRAMESFQHFGLKPIAAPTYRYTYSSQGKKGMLWVPDPYALYLSKIALHEIVGSLYYAFKQYQDEKAAAPSDSKDNPGESPAHLESAWKA